MIFRVIVLTDEQTQCDTPTKHHVCSAITARIVNTLTIVVVRIKELPYTTNYGSVVSAAKYASSTSVNDCH